MYSWEDPDDRVSIAQMNSELQHAQLELLSAHCATHQLRLRFSADDLARFGQRDILRKSIQAAAALSEYYTSIEKKIPEVEALSEPLTRLTEDHPRGHPAGGFLSERAARTLPPLRRASEQPPESPDVALFFGSSARSRAHHRARRKTRFQSAVL